MDENITALFIPIGIFEVYRSKMLPEMHIPMDNDEFLVISITSELMEEYYKNFYLDLLNTANGQDIEQIPIVFDLKKKQLLSPDLYNSPELGEKAEIFFQTLPIGGKDLDCLILKFDNDSIENSLLDGRPLSAFIENFEILIDIRYLEFSLLKNNGLSYSCFALFKNEENKTYDILGLYFEPDIEKGGRVKIVSL